MAVAGLSLEGNGDVERFRALEAMKLRKKTHEGFPWDEFGSIFTYKLMVEFLGLVYCIDG